MKRHRSTQRMVLASTIENPHRFSPLVTLILCLSIAVCLLQACALAPVVVVGTTAAAALTREVEVAVLKGDTTALVAVGQEAVVYSGPGEQYSAIDTLTEGVECEIMKQDGDWVECRSPRFANGWIRASCVKDI